MAGGGGKLGWRVYGGLAGALAGVAARKVVMLGWRLVTGDKPPTNPEHPGVSWGRAVGWASVSGLAVGLARLAATRQAALAWRRSQGSLPPGMDEVEP